MRTTPARTRSAKAPSSAASAPPTTFTRLVAIDVLQGGLRTEQGTLVSRCLRLLSSPAQSSVLSPQSFSLLRFARRHAQLGRQAAAQDADRDRLPDVLGSEAAAQIV